MSEPRIGVFVCGCGGNISDTVDIERVRAAVEKEPGVVTARTAMFTCSDATQQEIIDVIRTDKLDGVVVASCSPKLHETTFRAMTGRAGLNPYVYNQVNIREQCSWTHTHDLDAATGKAVGLVRAGIERTRQGRALDTIRIETAQRALIIGAGVTGLRAALSLADLDLEVHLVESAEQIGGQVATWGALFPSDRTGTELVETLAKRVRQHARITLYTSAKVVEKSGSVGDFEVTIESANEGRVEVNVGAIIVATGFRRYQPGDDEFGFGLPGVCTLDQFRELIDEASDGVIMHDGQPVRDVAYIYCVGSRQPAGGDGHSYCSRYCCTAAVHTSLMVSKLEKPPRQFHVYRDMRTYGKQELLYRDALSAGALFLKVADDAPPTVTAKSGRVEVSLTDQLTSGEDITIAADLVVLVTGMEARANAELVNVLKLPIGLDGFFNEIHPKLRPVETVLSGLLIAGAAQGPKTVPESVASGMAAAAKSAALLLEGHINLEPFIAVVDPALCTWCGACAEACPYGVFSEVQAGDKSIALVNPAVCMGCGACVPSCDAMAVQVEGSTHTQITSMIDALAREVA